MIKLLLRINAKLSRRSHPRYSLRDHASFEPFLPLSATSGDNFSGVRTISTWDEGNFRTVNDLRRSALTLHKWRHLNRYPVKIQAFHSQSSIESAAATAICSKTSFQSSHSGISKSFFKVGFINPCTRLGFKDGISRHCIFAVHCMPIRAHMGHAHDHHDHTHNDDTGEAGERVSRLGFLADIFLTVGKGCAGYVSGSTAVIADAAHSMSDVVLSGVALWIFKAARAPKDQMHPYGHGKFETLGALGISSMLLLTGGGIAWHAVEVLQGLLSATDVTNLSFHSDSEGGFFKLFRHEHGSHEHHTGHDIEHEGLALTATIISIGIKEGLYWITKKVGDARGSELLKANAWHHRSDAISSVIALLGVGGAMLGWRFLDPIAGILVSGLVLRAGLQTGYKSLQELVDSALPESVLSSFKATVMSVKDVKGCHAVRGRRAGSSIHLDVHIEVDPWLSVSAAHMIGEVTREKLRQHHSSLDEIFIHIEPAEAFASSSSVNNGAQGPKCNGYADTLNPNQQHELETVVRAILSGNFEKTITYEGVRCHFLQGRLLVELEVSMDPTISVRDGMLCARQAEELIMKAYPNISAVQTQLRLTRYI